MSRACGGFFMRGSALSRLAAVVGLVLVAGVLRVTDANPAMAQTQTIGAWRVSTQPSLDGSAPEWQSILPVFLPTTAQQITPPMGGGTVERLAVRAVHWNDRLYMMLEWADSTADLSSDRYEQFSDAAAIELPAEAGSAVPFVCMGQADQAVNIWQWRGDQEQPVPRLADNGYVDFYPSTDDLYYTARAAGNPLSQSGRSPVQNLVAGGFGTLQPSNSGGLDGYGVYSGGRWMVVFSRSFEPDGELQPSFSGDRPIDVAFAVWNGSKNERDGIKSVSSFTRLVISPEDAPRRPVAATDNWPAYSPSNPMTGVAAGIIVVFAALAIWMLLGRRRREPHGEQ